MARKKAVKDDVLEEVKGGVNLNELNNKVLSVESKADALEAKVDSVALSNDALAARVDVLMQNMEAKLADKQLNTNKSKSLVQRIFGFKENNKI